LGMKGERAEAVVCNSWPLKSRSSQPLEVLTSGPRQALRGASASSDAMHLKPEVTRGAAPGDDGVAERQRWQRWDGMGTAEMVWMPAAASTLRWHSRRPARTREPQRALVSILRSSAEAEAHLPKRRAANNRRGWHRAVRHLIYSGRMPCPTHPVPA
jgi:hypothetical protein